MVQLLSLFVCETGECVSEVCVGVACESLT